VLHESAHGGVGCSAGAPGDDVPDVLPWIGVVGLAREDEERRKEKDKAYGQTFTEYFLTHEEAFYL
jgi:hypothetical protein